MKHWNRDTKNSLSKDVKRTKYSVLVQRFTFTFYTSSSTINDENSTREKQMLQYLNKCL